MSLVLDNYLRSPFFKSQTWRRVKNGTGSVIPPFSLVLNNGITTSGDELVFTVIQPNNSSTDFNWNQYLVTGPFAIGANSGNEGLATCLTAPGYMRYDTGTPAVKEVWGPKHAQLTASKNYFGFEILGGNTTWQSNTITVARWIGVNEVLVKNGSGGDYSAGSGPSTYKVYIGTAGSETDSGMTLSCYNKSSVAFKDTKFGSAGRLNGGQVYAVPWQT